MSQIACFLTVENVLVEEVFYSLIDKQYERDVLAMHVQETIKVEPDQDYDCEMERYDIGDGESGIDHFVDDDDLIAWYKEGGVDLVIDKVQEQGYTIELTQYDSYCAMAHELETDDEDDED